MQGVLLLSHQGYSFVEDVVLAARRIGLETYVLSSVPAPEATQRLGELEALVPWLRVAPGPALESADVRAAIDELVSDGRRPLACISVWEGYRILMAEANARLGARDLDPFKIACILNKLQLRRSLVRHGLSAVGSEPVTRESLKAAQASGEAKFIKPQIGLGSYGAFRLRPETDFGQIEALSEEMMRDRDYCGLFGSAPQFVMEDFIPGIELSFELIVSEGRVHFAAVHEKLEVEEAHGATLENCCVSPPVSLTEDELREGQRRVELCLAALRLDTGCFHVEAKFDRPTRSWELIEVNPRVGGALIKESARMTGGACLLQQWLETLLRIDLSAGDARARELGAFFRVYFGEPGRVVREIRFDGEKPSPEIARVAVRPGAKLPAASREIFLGQALWRVERGNPDAAARLARSSKNALEVIYE